MYKLKITHRWPEDRDDSCWFLQYDFQSKHECLDYLDKNFDMEDPFLPYNFEITSPDGHCIQM